MNKKEYLLKVLGAIFIVVFLISMAACLFLIFPIEIDESYQGILAIYMFVVLVVFGIVFGLTEYEGLQGIGRMLLVSAVLLMVMVGCCKYLDVIPSDLEEYGVYTFTASSGERDILGGSSRQNPRQDKYYVKYDAELENGIQISFMEKVLSEKK